MFFGHAVFKAVTAVAVRALDARDEWGVDERLTRRRRALRFVVEDRGLGAGGYRRGQLLLAGARPCAFLRAGVCCFCAVV